MVNWVGNVALAPAARPVPLWVVTSDPAPGTPASGASARTMKMPTLNAGAATGPRLRTVLGADTVLPVSVPDGGATEATTRSARQSRIVSVAVLAGFRATLTI